MAATETELVNLVREFLAAHELMTSVVTRGRAGSLRWPEVQRLVGENDSSRLYRLKERSHQLSRARVSGDDLSRAALFDLAVGSLFHEAMKLRENFYQLEVYAPRVARAATTATPGTEALFGEFARILSASRERMGEAIDECEALIDQMRQQFRELLIERRDDGLVARFLYENREAAEIVLGESIDEFYRAALGGDAAAGLVLVSHSYLESGFFDEALASLELAVARRPNDDALERDRLFAGGMRAFRRGEYLEALDVLEAWVATGVRSEATSRRELAQHALEGLPSLLTGPVDPRCAERAGALARELEV